MELLKFLNNVLIDQFELVEKLDESSFVVKNNMGTYCLIVPVSNDICAMYEWNDYVNTDNDTVHAIVLQQTAKATILYQEYIRLLVDSIPRTCVEEVNTINQQYGIRVDFNPANCYEINPNELVKVYHDTYNKCWFVTVFDRVYALSNEKAALRIQEIIYYDSKNIIERRWRSGSALYSSKCEIF